MLKLRRLTGELRSSAAGKILTTVTKWSQTLSFILRLYWTCQKDGTQSSCIVYTLCKEKAAIICSNDENQWNDPTDGDMNDLQGQRGSTSPVQLSLCPPVGRLGVSVRSRLWILTEEQTVSESDFFLLLWFDYFSCKTSESADLKVDRASGEILLKKSNCGD